MPIPEYKRKAMDRWHHFGLVGRMRMALSVANSIVSAPSTTPEAKHIALEYQSLCLEILEALKERKNC